MRQVKVGSTDVSVVVRIVDSTDGTPEQAVTSATAGLAFWYRRDGGALVAIAPLSDLALLTTAHTDGGMLHIDDGYYRLDVPDAAFASGADQVIVGGAATDMVVIACDVQLVGYNPRTELTTAVLAYLDAAVSSRAAPGDTMDLVTDAVDAASLATSAIAELMAALRSDGLVPVAASAVSAYRDVTLSLPLTATTAGYTKIYFTVKNDPDNDADSAAVIQVKKNSTEGGDGLIALAGSTTLPSGITAADGSIGIVGTTVTVTVSAAAMAKLDIRSNMWYDLKVLISNVWSITNRGLFHVISTATKSIS